MAKRAEKKMCCVEVGFQSFLMPLDEGLKTVELLQKAVPCERTWNHRGKYVKYSDDGGVLSVTLTTLTPEQIECRPATDNAQLEDAE